MNCFSCDHVLKRGENFCPNCGRDVRPKRVRDQPGQSARIANREPQREFPRRDSSEAWEAATVAKQHRRNVMAFCVFLVGLAALGAGFAGLFGTGNAASGMGVLVVSLIVSVGVQMSGRYLSRSEYAALPHALQDDGESTRCIHCGHRGIYTHGKYKSNTTFHDCSKCGTTLFTS